MKNELVDSFVEGVKDSFRLAAAIVTAPAAPISAFMHHQPLSKPNQEKKTTEKIRQRQEQV